MAVPTAPNEGGGRPLHFLTDDNAGTNRASLFRGRKVETVNAEPLGDLSVYPTSGACRTGKKATTGATAIQLTTTSIPCQGMLVKAPASNGSTIWVGISTVTAGTADATDGFPLEPGESVGVPCRNANEIYIRGAAAALVAYWMASAD